MKNLITPFIFLLIFSNSNIYSQTFDLFADAYDYSLGEANIASSELTLQNPASFADNQSISLKASYQYHNIAGDLDFDYIRKFSSDIYNNFIISAAYKNWGAYFKVLKNHYQEETQWSAPNHLFIEYKNHTVNNILGLIYSRSLNRFMKAGIAFNYFIYNTNAIPEKGRAFDFSVGLDLLPVKSFRINFTIVNLLQSEMTYYFPNSFYNSIAFSATQRRLDISISQKFKSFIIYSAIKNILKHDIPHPNGQIYNTFPTFHLGASVNIFEKVSLQTGLKYEKLDVYYNTVQQRRYLNYGISYQINPIATFIVASSINNERTQNGFTQEEGIYSESGKGNILMSLKLQK